MKIKLDLKSFLAGVLMTILLIPVTIYANQFVTRTVLTGVTINLNGQIMQLPDYEQPFIYEGRTFLPVRAVSEALGVYVGWNEAETRVYLSTDALLDLDTEIPLTNNPLVGNWIWDIGSDFVYIFNQDGTGVRGSDNYRIEEFDWIVLDDNHLVLEMNPLTTNQYYMTESWTFFIEDNVLTIESRQVEGMIFSYILVD